MRSVELQRVAEVLVMLEFEIDFVCLSFDIAHLASIRGQEKEVVILRWLRCGAIIRCAQEEYPRRKILWLTHGKVCS